MAGLCEGGNEPPGSLKAVWPLKEVSDALEVIRIMNMFYEAREGSSEIATEIMNRERNLALESVYWASRSQQSRTSDYFTSMGREEEEEEEEEKEEEDDDDDDDDDGHDNDNDDDIFRGKQGLELNGLHQLPVYADDVNMLGENPQTIRENADSKAIDLEVNPEKTKYMIMSHDQNIVRNRNIKIGDLSFEEVEKFKYLGATVTNINDSSEEIQRRINMGNACYYSAEKLLSSSLQSKNLKIRIYKTVILPVVLHSCETWTLTLREEQRLKVYENKILRKIFRAKRDVVTGKWRKLHNAELHAL
ncbi:hypothetical protein ANN_25768 [Periplaneta americana]|uniref:Uncharacterized protein n=1 Tax=Periplaneta americana TaxID=6978 RepID=A0ABQ8S4V1_PERAM|nr:hypothetical protein ANN_25768 [Periplaneta americana]